MRRCAALAFLTGLLATSIGCGGEDDDTATSPMRPTCASFRSGTESAGLYAEGARSYVRIETVAEEQLVELELEPTAAGHEATIRLDPGDYRLVSWQRPCDGSCDSLDSPTDECSKQFAVSPRTAPVASIEVRAGEGCTIAFE